MFTSWALVILALFSQLTFTLGAVPVGFKAISKCKQYHAALEIPVTNDFIFPDDVSTMRKTPLTPKISKYPFAVLGLTETTVRGCGGTLISDRFVLISAQCIRLNVSSVVMSDVNFTLTDTTTRHAVKRQITHPGFKSRPLYNDIGLLELEKAVTFSEHLQPACLQTSRVRDDDGWFLTVWYSYGPNTELLSVTVSGVTNEECQSSGVHERISPYGVIEHLQLCVLDDLWQRFYSRDVPMTLMAPNKAKGGYAIIGIPSSGKRANVPQIYTRVSSYINWIESEVWPEEPTSGCNKFVFDM